MTTGGKKTIIISVLSTVLIISSFYFGARFASKKIVENLSAAFEKQFSRKLELGKISYSIIDGITVANIRISHPQNPRNIAYSIKKTAAFFELLPLLKGNFVLSKIKFKNANFRLIRNKNGDWDFDDVQSALPKPKDKFYLNWPRQIIAENSEIFIIDKVSDNMWKLQNADLKLRKRLSPYGGSFSLSTEGIFKGSFLKNAFVSKKIKTLIKANFENDDMNTCLGEIELKDSASGDIHFKTINLKWNFSEVNSKENKQNYKAEFNIEEMSAPNIDTPPGKTIAEAFISFSKIYGKKTPKINNVNLKNISAKTSLHKNLFAITDFKLNSDIFNINADFKLNKKTNELDLDFKGRGLDKEMNITAKGPYDNLYIKPEFSYTIRTKIATFLKTLSKNIIDKTNGGPHE